METSKNTPLSADEIIAEVEERIRGGKLSRNIEIMIQVLSEKALSREQLAEKLKETEYDFRGADSKLIRQRLHAVRRYGILDRLDGYFFIKGTAADPEIQDRVSKTNQPSGKKIGEPRPLRSIIYDVLQREPLSVNRLAAKVRNHPDYDDSRKYARNLLVNIQRTLCSEKKRFFEREDSQRFSRWRIKVGSNFPPEKHRQNAQTKRQVLHDIMRSRFVISGWIFSDLFETIIQPDSGYRVKPGSSLNSAKMSLYQMLISDEGELFECLAVKGEPKRWRAKWVGQQLKIPSTLEELEDLTLKVLADLASPLSLEELLRAVRQYGHLFGYRANELPDSFLIRGALQAVEGTKYQDQLR